MQIVLSFPGWQPAQHNFRHVWCRASALPNRVKGFREKKIMKKEGNDLLLMAQSLLLFRKWHHNQTQECISQKAKPKWRREIYLLCHLRAHFIPLPSMQSTASELVISWPETSRERPWGWEMGCGDRRAGVGDEGCRATLLIVWAIFFSIWLRCHCLTRAWVTGRAYLFLSLFWFS